MPVTLFDLFPAGVQFEVAREEDFTASLHPSEHALIERAVEKRKREFTAGRTCARRALQQLGYPLEYLLVGEQRQPAWPNEVVGTISHCAGFCAAAVATKEKFLSIGFDAEVNASLGPDLFKMILRPEEFEPLQKLPQNLPWERLTFSAKECIHKVYYPLNRYTLDFLDARISFNVEQQTFIAEVVNPAEKEQVALRTMQGRYCFTDEHIFTAITLFSA